MQLTSAELFHIRKLIIKWKNVIGKEDDRVYIFPRCLEEVKVIRYNDKKDPDNSLNGKLGIWLALTKERHMAVITFDNHWFEIPYDQFDVVQRLSELSLSNRDEAEEARELQEKLGEIKDEDFIDMYVFLDLISNGIDIFSKDIIDKT